MITILDYGAGNLRSVAKALEAIGAEARISSDPRALEDTDILLLPGVGAAGDAMRELHARGLVEPIRAWVRQDRPFIGVCLGLQLLFTWSEEGEGAPCLDLIPGTVRRFPPGLKVPHMGWNAVQPVPSGAGPLSMEGGRPEGAATGRVLFDGIPPGSHFYFVHSYYGQPDDPSVVAAETEYGVRFPSVIARGNLIAVQFHPEKSATLGLRFYANALRALGLSVARAFPLP